MGVREYMNWKEKRLIGASLTVTMPTGQYDPARLINPGTNRWGFKPEIGISQTLGQIGLATGTPGRGSLPETTVLSRT